MKKILLIVTLAGFSISAISQTKFDTIKAYITKEPVAIDGQATEECWTSAGWHAIDKVWMPFNATLKQGDFSGRFKVAWDPQYLYVLVEVVDDSLSDDYSNPLSNWWNDDCLEIFIDENRSMGDHERNCNAFAYHVSLFYDAIDLNSSGQGVNYKANIDVDMDTIASKTYLWELAIKNYDATFNISDPEKSRVTLAHNKLMGFAIAYCDNDETTSRENFIGSMVMTASTNNEMYRNADYFGPMLLLDPGYTNTGLGGLEQNAVKMFPNPASKDVLIELPSSPPGDSKVSIFTSGGKEIRSARYQGERFTVSIEDLAPGVYIFQINSGSDQFTKLFIKQ